MKYTIPEGIKPTKCRSCGAEIYFVRTAKGSYMPVDPDGEPHWATCPMADKHRK